MKAALNGVPSFSILDGWWIEGWIEGQTGWAVGEPCEKPPGHPERSACDAASLYDEPERVILPLYYASNGLCLPNAEQHHGIQGRTQLHSTTESQFIGPLGK